MRRTTEMSKFKIVEFIKDLKEGINKMEASIKNAPEHSRERERIQGQKDVLSMLERDTNG